MKYIITKIDTIEVLIHEDTDGTIITEKYDEFGNKVVNNMKSSWIKKSANTIEELCDRVVVKDFNNKEPIIYNPNKYNWKEVAKTLFNIRKVEWVKFAIWTRWGLKYVAKMNDKGELELL